MNSEDPHSPKPKHVNQWLRWLLAGNPFYPISATLLLFGIYQLAIDKNFLPREESKLIFNFSALQLYEMLAIAVAVFLSRRRIWYDSTLLVVLENVLLLVPFVLVSQAVLIGRPLALIICVAGVVAAGLRFAALKAFFRDLNMPYRLLILAAVVLAANLALPFIYRPIIEDDVANWHRPGLYCWFIVLPALAFLAYLLPRTEPTHRQIAAHQASWLPLLLYALWLTGSGVHLWAVGYISNLEFSPALIAPVCWAVTWVAFVRRDDFHFGRADIVEPALLVAPVLPPSLGLWHSDTAIFFTLTIVNALVYGILALLGRYGRVPIEVCLITAALAIAATPQQWAPAFTQAQWILLGFGGFIILQAMRSKLPQTGVCAAVGIMLLIPQLFPIPSFHFAVQCALAFVMIHSLRWNDAEHTGAAVLRIIVSAIWVLDAWSWAGIGGSIAALTALVGGLAVAAVFVMLWWLRGVLPPLVSVMAAILTAAAYPFNQAWHKLQTSPTGLLALCGSFLLFAIGTIVALAKAKWNHAPDDG